MAIRVHLLSICQAFTTLINSYPKSTILISKLFYPDRNYFVYPPTFLPLCMHNWFFKIPHFAIGKFFSTFLFLGFSSRAQWCYCTRTVIEWFFKASVLVMSCHDLCSALLHGYLMVFFVIACQFTVCTSLTICALTLGCLIISVKSICRVFG